jgi:hypothetical protein
MDRHDLRPLRTRLAPNDGVNVQLAEAPPESKLLLGRDVLIAEEDDLILVERLLYEVDRRLRELVAQIDAADFGAEHGI